MYQMVASEIDNAESIFFINNGALKIGAPGGGPFLLQSKISEYSTKIRGFPEGVVGMGQNFAWQYPDKHFCKVS